MSKAQQIWLNFCLLLASLARWAPAAVYLLVAMLVYWQIKARAPLPEPTAINALARNHQLRAGDLSTPDITSLVGKYLTEDVAAGEPVAKNKVQGTPVRPAVANSMAVVVSISAKDRAAIGVEKGSDVRLCLNNKDRGGLTKVILIDCDALNCLVSVVLPPNLTQLPGPHALDQAWLHSGQSQNCANPVF